MEKFEKLTGMKAEDVRETCILTPFFSKQLVSGFKVEKINKGMLCSTGNNETATLICTRMGSGFAGDAVLLLKETACKNIVFAGTCGAMNKKLNIGDTLLIKECYAQDSFINMLLQNPVIASFPASSRLYSDILKTDKTIIPAVCLSLGSLELEQQYLNSINLNIDVVDMETAAIYAAAGKNGMNSIAVLTVSDIIGKIPYYETPVNTINPEKIMQLLNTIKSS